MSDIAEDHTVVDDADLWKMTPLLVSFYNLNYN